MQDSVTLTSMVSRKDNIIFNKLDDELIAIDTNGEYCYSINAVAGAIWEFISSPVSVESLCTRLIIEYKVDELVCKRDVIILLNDLLESGLIQLWPNIKVDSEDILL